MGLMPLGPPRSRRGMGGISAARANVSDTRSTIPPMLSARATRNTDARTTQPCAASCTSTRRPDNHGSASGVARPAPRQQRNAHTGLPRLRLCWPFPTRRAILPARKHQLSHRPAGNCASTVVRIWRGATPGRLTSPDVFPPTGPRAKDSVHVSAFTHDEVT